MATFRSLPRHHERNHRVGVGMFASEESLSDNKVMKQNEKKIRFIDERR